MRIAVVLFLALPLMAQTDLYLPWVPQNKTFETTIIVNNHQGEMVNVTLIALRSNTERDETTVAIEPFGSYQAPAVDLFPQLGDGEGSVVLITSSATKLTASCVVSSTTTASGFSPAQMNAIPRNKAGPRITYHYLPVNSGNFSAPVVVNLGDNPADVTFRIFSLSQLEGTYQKTLLPGEVFARQTLTMFPNATGLVYVTAESDQPLIGASFVFNENLEPAMAPAQVISKIPDPFSTVTDIFLSSASSMRVGETQQVEARARFLQGDDGNANDLVTWTNGTPSLIQLVTNGPNAGQVTAISAGTAVVRANANGQYEFRTIEVLGRNIQLSQGLSCIFTHHSCLNWLDLTTPTDLRFTKEVNFTNAAPKSIEFFRIIGDVKPLKVKRLEAISSNENFIGQISGIQVGDIIHPGEVAFFSLDVSRISGTGALIDYVVEIEDQGEVLNYRVTVRSN